MLSPQALMRGIVQRMLPSMPNQDNTNTDVAPRMWPYGELATQPMIRKSHALADEGSYFVASTSTPIVPTYGTSQVLTSPWIVIQNGNAPGGPRLYLDYMAMTAAVAMVSTTTAGYTAIGIIIDGIPRYSSAGTVLTSNIVNANMLMPVNNSNAVVACGAIIAAAASPAARTLCGLRNIRPAISLTVPNVVGDMWLLNFGGVEQGASGQISITPAVANVIPQAFPPIVLGPGHSALIYMWFPVMSAPSAGTFVPEIGFWVR